MRVLWECHAPPQQAQALSRMFWYVRELANVIKRDLPNSPDPAQALQGRPKPSASSLFLALTVLTEVGDPRSSAENRACLVQRLQEIITRTKYLATLFTPSRSHAVKYFSHRIVLRQYHARTNFTPTKIKWRPSSRWREKTLSLKIPRPEISQA
jgi:hypothetical protein